MTELVRTGGAQAWTLFWQQLDSREVVGEQELGLLRLKQVEQGTCRKGCPSVRPHKYSIVGNWGGLTGRLARRGHVIPGRPLFCFFMVSLSAAGVW